MKFQIALLVGLACSALAAPVVDPQIFKALGEKGTASVIISFKKSNTAAVRSTFANIKSTLSTRSAKLNVLYNLLKDHADTTQANVRSFLDAQTATKSSLRVSQSWITNELIVRGVDFDTILALQRIPDIKEIKADRIVAWIEPSKPIAAPTDSNIHAQWGVDKVQAEAAWALGAEGEGVVVATIDTGVRGTHEALRNNHREENGWYDPAEGDKTPTDSDGHGTHTMGTICGQTNGIGVARKATWIACKGCGYFGCYLTDLTDCGNFAACPTDANGQNPRCDLAPALVSNSWGGGQGDDFYDEIIATWKMADIAPLFSIGNSGSSCGTANSPGDSADAISVGSTTVQETVSSFSSLGPSVDGLIKPDIAGPGSNVISADGNSDTGYVSLSGTSMACPHVAGVAALAYSKNANLSYDQIKAALYAGAQHSVPDTGRNCGNVREDTYPNNHVGHGRVDALETVRTL